MLQRLELVGFKSFADKTRFDFAPGITAIVGPNGSGKSNVVDAVRWILGEQSAKSLRGGEMADVIFNGSSSRKSLGMAEVSVTFDNARRLLSVDADQVQVTRRVYRDGTGEYLINGQMSRLKDIKEIFLGSGAGTGGYTIIAQGRVDELLQASTKDRREIFDEAAGISRFKAKKIEALRKLLVVEQNLTRSRDRLDGLDSQLRTLRMQAAKAQKYKEYADRLRELRVGLGLAEYRDLSAAIERERQTLAGLRAAVDDATARTDGLERTTRSLDQTIAQAEESLRHHEAKLAEARQHIAGLDASLKHERAAAAEHEAEVLRTGRQRAELGYRLQSLSAEQTQAAADLTEAEARLQARHDDASSAASELGAAAELAVERDRQFQADQETLFELARTGSAARTRATTIHGQVERDQKAYTRKLGEIEQKSAQRGALETALDGLSRADADLQARLAAARGRLTGLHTDRESLADRAAQARRQLEGLRVRQGDLRGRIEVLEGLERSLEGLGAGVREVLQRMKGDDGWMKDNQDAGAPVQPSGNPRPSPFSQVAGLVADLLTVPHDIAPLVELALGDAAQRFVVRDSAAVDAVAAAVAGVTGRVGFVPIDRAAARIPARTRQEAGPGAESLCDHVRCDHPDLENLPALLLGNVLLTGTLADARRIALACPGARLVTWAGELLEPDGTLTVGPTKALAGIVSRKSELRDLRTQLRAVTSEVHAAEIMLAELQRQIDALGGVIEAVETEIGLLSGEAGDLLQQIARQRQQVEQLDEQIELFRAEAEILEADIRRGEAEWVAAKLEADTMDRQAEALQSQLDNLRAAIQAGERDRARLQQAHTDAQVALSQARAERDRIHDRLTAIKGEYARRKIEFTDRDAAGHNARGRLAVCVLAMLRAGAAMADAYAEKERRERQVASLQARLTADRAERDAARTQLEALRSGWHETQTAAHAREIATRELQTRRSAVVARIQEDYGIDLGQMMGSGEDGDPGAGSDPASAVAGPSSDTQSPTPKRPSPIPEDRAASQTEIEELRRKLQRLGSVNMEALDELTRVEAEYTALKNQHDDLNAARREMQAVIDEINTDSRRLFTDTLTAVRGYFQELFRKLFGGGQADIVLENGDDVLESGIEITARPPGKELRSLSLLSGGEKTLTAVALLLAIFRNKPSPFCILDEVDAALDEANTQRLAGVLRDFLDRSQFIVITHKKRTMAAADRLWGVTMQESGVSRMLPMRFEDWQEDVGSQGSAA